MTPQEPPTRPAGDRPYPGQPYYRTQPSVAMPPRNGLGIAAVILGLVGLLFGLVPLTGFIGIICGIVGLVLGAVGVSRVRRGEATNRKTAVAGVVLSVLAGALGIAGMVIVGQVMDQLGNDLDDVGISGASSVLDNVPTPAPAAPAPESAQTTPPPAPQTINGSGSDVVDLARPVEVGVVVFECPRCQGNTILKSGDNLLVNTIGAYSGRRWLGFEGFTGNAASRFQVTATGSWTLTVGGLDQIRQQFDAPTAVTGSGDDVVLFRAAPDKVRLTHDGEANFIVQIVSGSVSFPDLAVNDIGPWEGTVPFPGGGAADEPAIVQITADGGWTMTPT